MRYTLDSTQQREEAQRAAALVAWAAASDSWISDDPVRAFRARGFGRYIKSTVDPILSTDTAVALPSLGAAFLGLVDAESLIGQLDGATRIPLGAAARRQVAAVTASEVAEGASKPVATITFDVGGPPTKVQAQVVITAESLRSLDAATQAGITAVLVSACAEATDRVLASTLTAGSPAGSADPGTLFSLVSNGHPRRPYLLGGYDALLSLTPGTLRDVRDMGIGVLASAAFSGLLVGIDAAGLLVSDGGIEVATARDASLALDDGGSPVSTAPMINLWQNNLACVRAERFLRLCVRSGAAAWCSTGSPA